MAVAYLYVHACTHTRFSIITCLDNFDISELFFFVGVVVVGWGVGNQLSMHATYQQEDEA